MELSLVGLQNAGKTCLVNAIATGGYSEDIIPTVGFNMRKINTGKYDNKIMGPWRARRFRTMWERYCRGVSAIVYIEDTTLMKATAEAALRKLEMKLEKKRSSSMDKIMNKLRTAKKRAQEMRSSMLANQAHQVTRTSHKAI
ncbi:hypothetical protein CRYUN_Cryun18bG0001100 [Craigia yunnanensis]